MKHKPLPDAQAHIRLASPQAEAAGELSASQRPQSARGRSVLVILAIVLFCLLLASLVLTVPYQQFRFSPAWILAHVQQRFRQLYLLAFGQNSAFAITLYQYLAVVLVGAALAACGCIFQGAFRNTLAGPSTMGVMSGGSLGCLVYMLLFVSAEAEVTYTTFDYELYLQNQAAATLWSSYAQQLCTLLGCFAGVGLILLVATIAGRGKLSATAMILSGTVFSGIISQFSMVIQYYMILQDPSDPRIEMVRELMMGSFDNVTSGTYLLLLAVPILLCLGLLLLLSPRMNLFAVQEEEALSMGANLHPLRLGVLALGTVLTAVVVSFCGHIGFLGFMIPLVGRKLVGPDMRRLFPACLMLGSILLLLVFDLAYITGLTGYLNLFTSSIGSLVLLATLFLRKGGIDSGAAIQGAPMGLHKGA